MKKVQGGGNHDVDLQFFLHLIDGRENSKKNKREEGGQRETAR